MPKQQKIEAVKELPEPEEESEFIEIPFRDEVLTVPRRKGRWKTRALLLLDKPSLTNNEGAQVLATVLGPEVWERVLDSPGDDFDALCAFFVDKVLPQVFRT